jgi:ribosomal protein S18 acetylase RimI-like enzyme
MLPTSLTRPISAQLSWLLDRMEQFNASEGIAWNRPGCEAALRVLLDDPSLGQVWIVGRAEEPCGYLVLTYNYDLEFLGRDAFITELWIDPPHRRQGLARGALRVLEQRCLEAGVRAVHLLVDPENLSAMALYRSLGFATGHRVMMTRLLR